MSQGDLFSVKNADPRLSSDEGEGEYKGEYKDECKDSSDLLGKSAKAELISLAGGGELLLVRAWIDNEQADQILQILRSELPWEQPEIKVYGKLHRIPRLQSWHGEPGAVMVYSGKKFVPQGWHPQLQNLRSRLQRETKTSFNSVLANLYRNGEDGMGWHADDEPELGVRPVIASISLGAIRNFDLRLKKNASVSAAAQSGLVSPIRLALGHGDLLIMRGNTQRYWQHALPKTKKVGTARVNLTYRCICPH